MVPPSCRSFYSLEPPPPIDPLRPNQVRSSAGLLFFFFRSESEDTFNATPRTVPFIAIQGCPRYRKPLPARPARKVRYHLIASLTPITHLQFPMHPKIPGSIPYKRIHLLPQHHNEQPNYLLQNSNTGYVDFFDPQAQLHSRTNPNPLFH